MTFKQKSSLWILTFPFAHRNYTMIGGTLYCPGLAMMPPPEWVVDHEQIHADQQNKTGLVRFILLYLFALPLFWNPWRFKWEWEAYRNGTKLSRSDTLAVLRSFAYGWLANRPPEEEAEGAV